MEFDKLFTPFQINGCEIKNRFVVPAMVTNFCTSDGNITDQFIAYHEAKAKGGFGLIITEDFGVNPNGIGYKNCIRLYDEKQVARNKEFTDKIHQYGTKLFAQIFHPGRQTNSSVNGGIQPVAASKIPDSFNREIPHELTIPEIKTIVNQFGKTAGLMKAAGYDGIELHLAHGYLLAGFLSLRQNRRTDDYGGCLSNRLRIVHEIYQAMRKTVGPDFPITARISLTEGTVDGRKLPETLAIVKDLEKTGFDALNLSNGEYTSYADAVISSAFTPRGNNEADAKEVRKTVNIPLIVANGINDPVLAESLLDQNVCDFIGMARASLADPELPNKTKAGNLNQIDYCIRCLQGCEGGLLKGSHISCLVNPMIGNETKYPFATKPKPKKVLVIGGGPAGMEAAITAARRGHDVTLWEKTNELGGEFIPATYPPAKGEYVNLLVFLRKQLAIRQVHVELQHQASVEDVMAFNADKVIMATGSDPNFPHIPGIENVPVHFARDVLVGKDPLEGELVVIGGGEVGTETAAYLADAERGHVTVIEMTRDINAGLMRTVDTKRFFRDHEVTVMTDATVQSLSIKGVTVRINDETRTISADGIVLATGYHSDNQLYKTLSERLPESQLVAVGDTVEATNALVATQTGFAAGYSA
ncbi:oxidoreductase [Secundilactobacillus mixtipabuli]|uniref:NADH-dependent flavin oxidoreductase n=1 Tax=Secundilactobacillus mixtipabuli TaxID=1435342 RepID=A0A1Z5IA51_9LACO|nr:FAD-dependent oxidoreductase [Secundilactobacillus mixtipabuli]GAW98498.1 NADH-dependent flavin oxidoreductase [Secundilactobacillus mixtipabuli]